MNFKYTIDITADPEEVFTALTNPFQIELWSGYPAEMKAEDSCFLYGREIFVA